MSSFGLASLPQAVDSYKLFQVVNVGHPTSEVTDFSASPGHFCYHKAAPVR